MRKGYVYILCNKPYGTLYVGVTSNLNERLHAHRIGTASEFTKKYGVTRLVYYEMHELVSKAIQRETSLKRWKRDWKIELIEKSNPDWKDLDYTLM
ncbi:MAG: GIY-YIG nuclease family protein [Alphaproteobacteria bacterium]|nr:GIY-YIG nuclease family protein [Alphaproteobacteria bacterium]MBV9693690.1 GIY-YIG nuclease family protein [Alphaproteobacteria bacterium]